jgi:acyl carrier protein
MLTQFIQNFLITHAKIDPSKFDQPDLMVADLALDSLTLVETIFEIEDRFGFQIADPVKFQSMSFRDMVAAIEAQVREHNNGELPPIEASRPSAKLQ